MALTAWQGRRRLAICEAVLLSSLRLWYPSFWVEEVDSPMFALLNASIRGAVLLVVAELVVRNRMMLQQIRVLNGLLPVCSFCQSIPDESGKWEPMEFYIMKRSEASFTHTYCPTCLRERYGHLLDDKSAGNAAA